MLYEIQIFAKDRQKIIRFEANDFDNSSFRKQRAWEDLYYALGNVIDQKADKIRENDALIGRIVVKNTPYDQVLDDMCEDLDKDLVRLLSNNQNEVLI